MILLGVGFSLGVLFSLGILFWRVIKLEEKVINLSAPDFSSVSRDELEHLVGAVCQLQECMTQFADQVQDCLVSLDKEIKETKVVLPSEEQPNLEPEILPEIIDPIEEKEILIEEEPIETQETQINTEVGIEEPVKELSSSEKIIELAETGARVSDIAQQLQLGIGEVQLMLQVARKSKSA